MRKQGEKLGCTEALFSLGDKPEMLFPEMRETLRRLGYRSTLHYLEAMCELVLRETRLLPHANPGLLSANWIERLRASNPSLGLMLESRPVKRCCGKGAAHDNAPDKLPALRLKTIEDAGKLGVPFTTGILIGIGETLRRSRRFAAGDQAAARASTATCRKSSSRISAPSRGFRWRAGRSPTHGDMLRTLAVARLLLRDMNIQAPPNLTENGYERLLEGGINDWGGVSPLTPDYINPEAPWPHLARPAAPHRSRRTEACSSGCRSIRSSCCGRGRSVAGLLAERLAACDLTTVRICRRRHK